MGDGGRNWAISQAQQCLSKISVLHAPGGRIGRKLRAIVVCDGKGVAPLTFTAAVAEQNPLKKSLYNAWLIDLVEGGVLTGWLCR